LTNVPVQQQQSMTEIRNCKSATKNPLEKDRRVHKMPGLILAMQIENVDSHVSNKHVIM